MTDLHRKELEQFRDYGGTFLGSLQGQRVLADLMKAFRYNQIQIPADDMNMAKLDGSRDVIRYILDKLGFGEKTENFVKALSMVIPEGPEPYKQTEAETE